ncbi:MAG: ATP-binding protein [Candidatus Woesearchaeota archaeon]
MNEELDLTERIREIADGELARKVREAPSSTDLIRRIDIVSDEGTGIPADILPKIFGAYTKGKSDGKGIGLQMLKRLVDLRNGHIVVTSTTENGDTYRYNTRTQIVRKQRKRLDRGTTFQVYLEYMKMLEKDIDGTKY